LEEEDNKVGAAVYQQFQFKLWWREKKLQRNC
jgi:hypothetical protein